VISAIVDIMFFSFLLNIPNHDLHTKMGTKPTKSVYSTFSQYKLVHTFSVCTTVCI